MLLALALLWPAETLALPPSGAELFDLHCAGCHPNGGNIIRRGKTLKLKALEQQGINNAEAIAAIARTGIGQMSGYAEDGKAMRHRGRLDLNSSNAWIRDKRQMRPILPPIHISLQQGADAGDGV